MAVFGGKMILRISLVGQMQDIVIFQDRSVGKMMIVNPIVRMKQGVRGLLRQIVSVWKIVRL